MTSAVNNRAFFRYGTYSSTIHCMMVWTLFYNLEIMCVCTLTYFFHFFSFLRISLFWIDPSDKALTIITDFTRIQKRHKNFWGG